MGKSDFSTLIRFGLVGVGATLLYGILTTLLIYSNIAPLVASTIAYCICATYGYMGHRIFSFKSKAPRTPEIYKFAIMNIGSLILATIVMSVASGVFNAPIIGTFIVMTMIPISNFFIAKLYVFSNPDYLSKVKKNS